MLERELKLYEFMRQECHRLVADLTDEHLARIPSPGVNPPGWLLGHLIGVTDFPLRLLGLPTHVSDAYREKFGGGSQPSADPSYYPAKDELLAEYDAGHRRVADALTGIAADALIAPHGRESFGNTPLDTIGDVIGHVLTTHEALHLGQLSTWRQTLGLPKVSR